MKKTIYTFLIFLNTTIFAQALDPAKVLTDEVNNINDIGKLWEIAQQKSKAEQYDMQEIVLNRLIQLRPFDPNLRFTLIKSYAQQNKKSEAYDALIEMQSAGLSYPIGDKKGFDNIKGTGVFEYIEESMEANANPFGEGVKAFEVSHNYSGMLFENLTYDEKADRFLLGSVRSGDIYQYSDESGFKSFIDKGDPTVGPWGVIDLIADNKGDLLWVASATLPHYTGTTQANFGHSMISKYKLSTGELLKNYMMSGSQQPMLFTTLHLTKGQDLYFINAFSNDLFRIKNGSENVEPMLSLKGLNSIKAITSNNKQNYLYISDFEMGIFVLNLESLKLAPLVRSNKGFVAGINDLFFDDGDLVAIQSGVNPARLMRYVLKEDLLMVNMFPIEASNEHFKSLGNGTLVGDHVYYAANSQWANVDALGRLLPDSSWEPLVVMKSPTKYKMEEHMERMRKLEEIKKKRGIK
jgi:hypothetical protein